MFAGKPAPAFLQTRMPAFLRSRMPAFSANTHSVVGAGLPAKRPVQATTKSTYTTITGFCLKATEPSHSLPSMAPSLR
ncbi:hypothetical protein PRJ_5169 [Pseudomonas sp. XWY-1]|nr:hypothetical protein PRJ_5169 [Pseudomonas sp. XWY-1]